MFSFMKKWAIGIGVVVVVAALFFWWQKTQNDKKVNQIVTSKAVVTTFTKKAQSSGKTKAKRSALLHFQTAGKLSWVGVAEGDRVSAGQILAKLDPREVEKNLAKALTDYSKQRNDFEEMWRVTYQGTPNPDVALNDTAKRILQKNQWDLNRAVVDVELKALSVEYANLTSPISGTVTKLSTPVAGINVLSTTDIVEVSDPESLVFEANIDEVDVGSLAVGQPAFVSLDAFPNASFSGTVSAIAYSSQLSGGGATVFPVTIAFDTPQNVRIGLNGDVAITTYVADHVLVIPIEAVREEDKGVRYVYKKVGTSYQKTSIETGLTNDQSAVVLSGISSDDDIVVKGFSSISGK